MSLSTSVADVCTLRRLEGCEHWWEDTLEAMSTETAMVVARKSPVRRVPRATMSLKKAS